jgi:uncharacterized membrane protein YcaP (DUF421 family)
MSEVKVACMESDGHISVVKADRPTTDAARRRRAPA